MSYNTLTYLDGEISSNVYSVNDDRALVRSIFYAEQHDQIGQFIGLWAKF